MSQELERLRTVAQTEIDRHLQDAERLAGVAKDLLDNSQWHVEQATSWQEYMGGLVVTEAVIIPLPRRSEENGLKLIQGGLGE